MGSCRGCGSSPRAVLNKAVNIVSGTTNLVFKDGDTEFMALSRLKECNACEFRYEILRIGNTIILGCEKCGCPIETKCRAEREVCPVNKW